MKNDYSLKGADPHCVKEKLVTGLDCYSVLGNLDSSPALLKLFSGTLEMPFGTGLTSPNCSN